MISSPRLPEEPPPRAEMSQRSFAKRPKGLRAHFSVFSLSSSFRLEAPARVRCGLVKSSPGFGGGKRMCLLQHFYAVYSVEFVFLIEPSRPFCSL